MDRGSVAEGPSPRRPSRGSRDCRSGRPPPLRDEDVPELAGETRHAEVQPAADDEPAADARRDLDIDDVGEPGPRRGCARRARRGSRRSRRRPGASSRRANSSDAFSPDPARQDHRVPDEPGAVDRPGQAHADADHLCSAEPDSSRTSATMAAGASSARRPSGRHRPRGAVRRAPSRRDPARRDARGGRVRSRRRARRRRTGRGGAASAGGLCRSARGRVAVALLDDVPVCCNSPISVVIVVRDRPVMRVRSPRLTLPSRLRESMTRSLFRRRSPSRDPVLDKGATLSRSDSFVNGPDKFGPRARLFRTDPFA